MIELADVHRIYQAGETTVHAIRGVSMHIGAGDFVAIMGMSGSGKSTLMNLLGCLDRPTRGRYLFDGADVAQLDRDGLAALRNRKLGFVFQSFNLLPRTTALENVELPMLCGGRRLPAQAVKARAERCLAQVGLADRAGHFSNQLSGGQQQRVAIARALVNEPRVILADEPTGNLDTRTAVEVIALFQQLNAAGITVVMVTHEQEIARYCRRIVTLRDGRVVRDEPVTRRLDAAETLQVLSREAESFDAAPPPQPELRA
jgi:putative ABC transport system ATP-binding protein